MFVKKLAILSCKLVTLSHTFTVEFIKLQIRKNTFGMFTEIFPDCTGWGNSTIMFQNLACLMPRHLAPCYNKIQNNK